MRRQRTRACPAGVMAVMVRCLVSSRIVRLVGCGVVWKPNVRASSVMVGMRWGRA